MGNWWAKYQLLHERALPPGDDTCSHDCIIFPRLTTRPTRVANTKNRYTRICLSVSGCTYDDSLPNGNLECRVSAIAIGCSDGDFSDF